MFVMILASFAFAFIFSAGSMSAATTSTEMNSFLAKLKEKGYDTNRVKDVYIKDGRYYFDYSRRFPPGIITEAYDPTIGTGGTIYAQTAYKSGDFGAAEKITTTFNQIVNPVYNYELYSSGSETILVKEGTNPGYAWTKGAHPPTSLYDLYNEDEKYRYYPIGNSAYTGGGISSEDIKNILYLREQYSNGKTFESGGKNYYFDSSGTLREETTTLGKNWQKSNDRLVDSESLLGIANTYEEERLAKEATVNENFELNRDTTSKPAAAVTDPNANAKTAPGPVSASLTPINKDAAKNGAKSSTSQQLTTKIKGFEETITTLTNAKSELGTAFTALEKANEDYKKAQESYAKSKSPVDQTAIENAQKDIDYRKRQINNALTEQGVTNPDSKKGPQELKDEFNKKVDEKIKANNDQLAAANAELAKIPKTPQTLSEVTGGIATISELKSLSKEERVKRGLYDGEFNTDKNGNVEVIKGSNKYTIDPNTGTVLGVVDMGIGAPSEYSIFGLFKWTTSGWGHTVGNLVEGVAWAGAVIGAIKIFQEIGFIPEKYAKPLYQSIAGGIMAGKALYGLLKTGTSNQWWKSTSFLAENAATSSFIVGAVVAYLIFSYTYKEEKTETKTLTFKCMSWQAPRGGEKCGECNKDPMRPCSEYRCKALGQSCELLNKGTGQEKCEWVNRNDAISPVIKPWNQVLTNGYVYVSSASGMIIQRATENDRGNKCIDPYTPIEFGILTSNENNQGEPAQCKIEYTRTKSFSEMQYYFGDSNLYIINHSQKLSMPSISSLKTMGENETEGLPMEQTPGEYTFYVRCADANGNENEKEFAVRFCIDEGEDMTAPIIKGTSFGNQTIPVQFGQDNLSIEVYTNEPAQCKWEREDRDYDFMGNPMTCSNNVRDMNSELLYTCRTTLTSIEDRKNNDFFFRCIDTSKNKNPMQEGYQFTVIGTQPLDIIAVSPNGTIAGSTSIVKTTLHVETANGYNNGESRCFYSPTGENSSYTEFFYNTSEFTNIHDQVLDLGPGTYHYYFRCIDLGGNSAQNSTTFNLETDRGPPVIIRVYNGNKQLLIMTDEVSDCRYNTQSCSFNFNEGLPMSNANSTVHETEWKEQNYYIKCADIYNNQPYPTECSIVARPYSA